MEKKEKFEVAGSEKSLRPLLFVSMFLNIALSLVLLWGIAVFNNPKATVVDYAGGLNEVVLSQEVLDSDYKILIYAPNLTGIDEDESGGIDPAEAEEINTVTAYVHRNNPLSKQSAHRSTTKLRVKNAVAIDFNGNASFEANEIISRDSQ